MIFSATGSFADAKVDLNTGFETYEEFHEGILEMTQDEFNKKLSLTTASQAGEWHLKYLNTGFNTLDEFMLGLENMPADQFAKKGALTSATKLSDWHQALLDVKPEYFEKWNVKLRGLPSIGFKKDEHHWELHQGGIDADGINSHEVGYVKHIAYKPFASKDEFLNSLSHDETDILQGRVRVTSSTNLDQWLEPIRKEDPKTYEEILDRLQELRKVGFSKKEQFQFPEDLVQGSKNKVGYAAVGPIDARPKNISLPDFISLYEKDSPEALGAQYVALTKARRLSLLRELKSTKPEIYGQVLAKLRSRTAVGYIAEGKTPELIQRPKHRVQNRIKIGFIGEGEENEQLEHPNPESKSGLKKFPH